MTPPPSRAASDGDATPERGRKPRAGEAVLDRAFKLLRCFDSDHRVQPLASLAQRTGMPRSSALRLVRQLTEAGALERLEDGDYVVGLRLLELASLAPRGHGLRSVAMPYMEDLFHVTRQHVLLAVRDGDDALLVERLSAHDATEVRFRVGGRMPLTATGVGLVLLAYAPTDVQEELLRDFAPHEDVGLVRLRSADELRRALAEVRRGGYAVAQHPGAEGLATAAAPVHDEHGVVAALSVVVPSNQFTPHAYVTAVRTGARAISRQLGGQRQGELNQRPAPTK
ncbi:IclR family transcriptional regulator [Streptomyces sp. NPDC002962]|uniref:IclR family transcriptional regulator n=1 Tax=Streptomyces sp. NPDC002962 TaxID=3364674 RepID=UPI003690B0BF